MYPMFYHGHHLLHMDDLIFWKKMATEANGQILELGCGTGRILIPLAKSGCAITGIDDDSAMLSYLQKQITPELENKIDIYLLDITESFDLGIKFPLIIFPCNTYSTFNSHLRQAILRNIKLHLAPNGLFVFSIPNPAILKALDPEGEPELEDRFQHPETGQTIEVYSSWWKESDPRGVPFLTFQWVYHHLKNNSEIEIFETTTSHVLDPLEKYLSDLDDAGLIKKQMFGDFENRSYTQKSTYCILVAGHKC